MIKAHTLGSSQPPLIPALGVTPSSGIRKQVDLRVHM